MGYYVNSGAQGQFSITNHYTCSTDDFLYVLATGGNPGLTGTDINNAAIALVSPLGLCQNLSTTSFTVVNEVTTAAMAYTFHGFMSGPLQVSIPISAAVHLNTSFSVYNTILADGYAVATTASGNTFSQKNLNTVANALSVCVNTPLNTSTPCSNLLTNYATSTGATGGTSAPDTATAAWNIANNPAAATANLVSSQTATPAFLPNLATTDNAPNLTLTITNPAFGPPNLQLCVDANDNVWFTKSSTVDALTPAGLLLSGGSGFSVPGMTYPSACSISPVNGDVVFADLVSIDILTPTGGAVGYYTGASSGYVLSVYASALAITATGNIWEDGYDSSDIGVYSKTGTAVTTSSTAPAVSYASYPSVDSTGRIVVADSSGNLTIFNPTTLATIAVYQPGANFPNDGPALDSADNIFVAGKSDNIIKLDKNGNVLSGTNGYTGAGLGAPQFISVDGAGSIWATGLGDPITASALSGLTNTGTAITPSNGFPLGDSDNDGTSNVIDGAGNVWTFENGPGSFIEFIGVATPVYVPLTPGKVGIKP